MRPWTNVARDAICRHAACCTTTAEKASSTLRGGSSESCRAAILSGWALGTVINGVQPSGCAKGPHWASVHSAQTLAGCTIVATGANSRRNC